MQHHLNIWIHLLHSIVGRVEETDEVLHIITVAGQSTFRPKHTLVQLVAHLHPFQFVVAYLDSSHGGGSMRLDGSLQCIHIIVLPCCRFQLCADVSAVVGIVQAEHDIHVIILCLLRQISRVGEVANSIRGIHQHAQSHAVHAFLVQDGNHILLLALAVVELQSLIRLLGEHTDVCTKGEGLFSSLTVKHGVAHRQWGVVDVVIIHFAEVLVLNLPFGEHLRDRRFQEDIGILAVALQVPIHPFQCHTTKFAALRIPVSTTMSSRWQVCPHHWHFCDAPKVSLCILIRHIA